MNGNQALRFSILALALAPLIASAAGGGAFEINQDCAIAGCFAGDGAGFPITISAPGSYVLTSDLLVTAAGANAININASPVDLNLNGHTIDGGGSCTGMPVTSCTPGAGSAGISAYAGGAPVGALHIHDGTIRGFTGSAASTAAIYISDAGDGTVLERLNIVENYGNAAVQFYTSGAGGTVRLRDSQVARNGSHGVNRAGGAIKLIVENSDISGNRIYGAAGADGATFSGNRFNNNGNYAINGIGGTVALGANTFSGNNLGGNQYTITNVANLGGSANNVCLDHSPGYACP
ncbi:hypothetical protein [Dokdonella soli]|uniref:Right handed beta helix domain-containing protein n=1 Tax=Dokdonella soli TaxID=529810 RepID=A0ABN1IL34_9GAMM